MSPIQSKVFQHEQEYFFKFHTPKLESLSKDEPRLRDYLLEIYNNCPDEFFSQSLRCSQTKLKNVELRKRAKNNGAMALAKSALRNVKNNRMRHPAVQDFMLANDSATIACEVPVYLAPWEVPGMDRPLSGHIDILQIRGGEPGIRHCEEPSPTGRRDAAISSNAMKQEIAALRSGSTPRFARNDRKRESAPRNDKGGASPLKIWILDYKPNARYNIQKYMTQVFLYGVCLSRRTKISMDNIGLAYFDDTHYFEVSIAKQGELI